MILILFSIYVVVTFPHSLISKGDPVTYIRIDYNEVEKTTNHNSLPLCFLETKEDIYNFIDLIKNYKYRYYFFEPYNGSHKPTSLIMIRIHYVEEEYDTIDIDSDGVIRVNSKPTNNLFIGREQARQLYQDIYNQIDEKLYYYTGTYEIHLPEGYSLIRSSVHAVTLNRQIDDNNWGEAIIPAEVVEIASNDKYILAKQIGLKKRSPINRDDTYEIPDESNLGYWILEIENDNIYGPLKEIEFMEKKEELDISSMKLINLYNYKNK
jgi:hypothetical protein